MKTFRSLLPAAVACLLPLASNTHASPGEDDVSGGKTLAPYFVILGSGGGGDEEGESESLPLKKTDAKVRISGIIAEVELRQVYRNTGNRVLEAIYVFPGSTKSAVHGLQMEIGDRKIEAEIAEKKAAKQKYEVAKASGQTAALLEQERPNVFQMSVGHILPGDDVSVTLRYTELLTPTDRVYEFVFPTVVGPRYSNRSVPAGKETGDAWVANPFLKPGTEREASFDISVELAAGMPVKEVTCDTHPVRVAYEGADRVRIGLESSAGFSGDRDFVLRYRLAGNRIESGLLLHEDTERKENFFLLTVQPPNRVTPADVPGREYVFVVDVSGSMRGFPLDITKRLMSDLIRGLRPDDRFNVLTFASGSRLLSDQSVPATAANVEWAIAFLDGERGGGGTELTVALERALDLPTEDGVSRTMVLVTDGYVDFERATFQLVRERLNEANLFPLGIGSSVNRFLIEGLARAGQGEPFIVLDPASAPAAADRLREMVASPVMTDVTIDFGKGFDVYDVEPTAVPDLLADRPLVVHGKYRGKPSGEIVVTGISGSETRKLTLPVEPAEGAAQLALPYLWARQRIASLADDFEMSKDDETRREVTTLGLTYHLLTRFTSFVAIDAEVRPAEKGAGKQTTHQPSPLPQGTPVSAVGGGTIPEPTSILLLLTGMGSMIWQGLRRRRGAKAN
ncbi:MAG: VWA domain-containing protein [Verrucomicrobiae bacterium]|nr:VWA domain-containing protein [Verrucomicrobiae bacterium]